MCKRKKTFIQESRHSLKFLSQWRKLRIGGDMSEFRGKKWFMLIHAMSRDGRNSTQRNDN